MSESKTINSDTVNTKIPNTKIPNTEISNTKIPNTEIPHITGPQIKSMLENINIDELVKSLSGDQIKNIQNMFNSNSNNPMSNLGNNRHIKRNADKVIKKRRGDRKGEIKRRLQEKLKTRQLTQTPLEDSKIAQSPSSHSSPPLPPLPPLHPVSDVKEV